MPSLPKYILPDDSTVEIDLLVPSSTYAAALTSRASNPAYSLAAEPWVASYCLSEGMSHIARAYRNVTGADAAKAAAARGEFRNVDTPILESLGFYDYNPPNLAAFGLGWRVTPAVALACEVIGNMEVLLAHRDRVNAWLPRADEVSAMLRMMDRSFSRRVPRVDLCAPVLAAAFDVVKLAMWDLQAAGAGHCLPDPGYFHTYGGIDGDPVAEIVPADLWPSSQQELAKC